VLRIDPVTKAVVRVARQGDGPSGGMNEPWMLAPGGPDLLIVDRGGALWRWRPSNAEGGGTLSRVRVGGDTAWGRDVIDVGTYLTDIEAGLYNFYVLDPSSEQVLRYLPAADGSGFPSPPTGYLATAADVSAYREMYIDGDLYALRSNGIVKYENGRIDRWELADPPDAVDTRPDRDYRLLAGTGPRGEGRLYVWDAANERIIVFDKENGEYVEQFIPRPPTAPFSGVRGLFAVEGVGDEPPLLYWLIENRLFVTALEDVSEAAPSRSPATSPSESPQLSPSGSPASPAAVSPSLSPGASALAP
jgi:hypothetical protein